MTLIESSATATSARTDPEPSLPAAPAPLRGRDAEQARLHQAVERARTGRGTILVVQGEVGIGKSRLLTELAESARQAGFDYRIGRGEELEAGRPFGIIRAMLAGPARGALAQLDEVIDEASARASPATNGFRPDRHFWLVDGYAAHLEGLATGHPLCVIVDDLHWADEGTLAVLAMLARRVADLPLILAVARREPSFAGTHAALSLRLEGVGALTIQLGSLRTSDVGALVNDLLAGCPGPGLLAETARAAGNPFFVTELVRSLVEEGQLVRRGSVVDLRESRLPFGFRQLVLQRLASLSPDTVDLLRAASLFGREVLPNVLAQMGHHNPLVVTRAVLEAMEAGLLVEEDGSLAFRHDLLRQALYDALPAPLRSHLHVEAARTLAASGAEPLAVASHYTRSAADVGQEAFGWLVAAAETVRLTGPRTAVALLERALSMLDADDARRPSVHANLTDVLLFSGQLRAAEAQARSGLARGALSDGDRWQLTYALAQTLFLQGRLEEAGPPYAELTGALGRTVGASRAAPLADWSMVELFAGRLERARELAAEVRNLPAGELTAAAEAAALSVAATVDALRGDPQGGLRLARQAVAAADATGGAEAHRYLPAVYLAELALWADDLATANEALDRAFQLGQQLQLGWDEPIRQETLVRLLVRSGRWDDAVAQAEGALQQSRDVGVGFVDIALHCELARIATARGCLDDAANHLADAVRLATEGMHGGDHIATAQALLAEAGGDLDRALAIYRQLWSAFTEAGLCQRQTAVAPDAVRVALRAGDDMFAQQVAADARVAGERMGRSHRTSAERCNGLVRRDSEALEHAAARFAADQRPVDQALTLWEAAEATNDTARRARLHAAADPLLDRLGVRPQSPWVRRASAPVARPAARFGWGSLTESETRVVELLADGHSNAEIAAQLICSRRTVESHLHHVYTKLGLSSRVGLVVAARERMSGAHLQ